MKALIAFLVLLFCSEALAARRWIPEHPNRPRPPQHTEPTTFCEVSPRYEWRQRVLRTYWVRLPCGRLELWEDVLDYRVLVSD